MLHGESQAAHPGIDIWEASRLFTLEPVLENELTTQGTILIILGMARTMKLDLSK